MGKPILIESTESGPTSPSPELNPVAIPQQTTPYLWAFMSVICLIAWIANFDYGYSGIVLAMPAFNTAFGHCMPETSHGSSQVLMMCSLTPLQQSLTSIASLFQGVGAGLAGVIGAYFGRRGTVSAGCAFTTIGAAGMLGTSPSYLHYMICKCVAAVGIGMLVTVGIIYGAECAPPSVRGLLLGTYNIALAFGNVASAAVCAGSATLKSENNWQWKSPILCQVPLGLSLGLLIWCFPESPRWLMVNGQEMKARAALAKFLNSHSDSDNVTSLLGDIGSHIDAEKTAQGTQSWSQIFGRRHIRRTSISAFILVGLMITGIQFVAPYTALFLSGLGVKNPFITNVIVNACIFAGSLISPLVLEYGGRRFGLLSGYSILASCMLIFSAVSTGLGSASSVAQQVLVAFLCIWAFTFGSLISPSSWVASAEMHSVYLRTHGQANTTVLSSIFGFAAQFWTPYMLSPSYGDLGTNVGYFYFGITTVVLVITFFVVPETARLSLEQVDDFFESGRSARMTSTVHNKMVAKGELTA
nr:high-affinity glucose transporter ght2 [Quercus suber]